MSEKNQSVAQRALACRVAAGLFLLAACLALFVPALPLLMTGESLAEMRCSSTAGCTVADGSLSALDEDVRAELLATPGAEVRFADHLDSVPVQAGLAIVTIARGLPIAVLLFGVAMALRVFGRVLEAHADFGRALRWLRITAWASLVAAIWPAIDSLLRSALLLPGTPYGAGWMIEADFAPLGLHLLLAAATFAVVWALDAGLRAQRDLAEIV